MEGTLDSAFGTGGKVLTDVGRHGSQDEPTGVATQNNGKILVSGWSTSGGFALVRYGLTGNLDASFGTGGKTLSTFGVDYGLAIQKNGKIILAGAYGPPSGGSDFALARHVGG